jgi:hypothetical protein
MERNVKISLEKAREWHNSGNESLKEVALQAFNEDELTVNPWEKIKTYEDACRTFIHHGINPGDADLIDDPYLRNIYKLHIIRRALNGMDWEPNLNTGRIYYPWLRYYLKDGIRYINRKSIANFKAKEDAKIYTLFGGDYNYHDGGLGVFECGYSDVSVSLGLFGCKTAEIAKYFGETFGKLIFDAIYGHYNNYEWVSN